jgi:hypothetical protein
MAGLVILPNTDYRIQNVDYVTYLERSRGSAGTLVGRPLKDSPRQKVGNAAWCISLFLRLIR